MQSLCTYGTNMLQKLKARQMIDLPPRREIPSLPHVNLLALLMGKGTPLVAGVTPLPSSRRTRVAMSAAQTFGRIPSAPVVEKSETFNKPWTDEEVCYMREYFEYVIL